MRACQCEAAAAAEGVVQGQLSLLMQVLVNIEPYVDGKGTEVGTEWEASINFYREALSFESEKFFEPGNRSVQTLSYSSPLRRGEGAEGVAEMEMRLRYHPATCEGGHVSVGVPSLRTCSVGHLSCVVHSKGPETIMIPTGRMRDRWIADVSTVSCVTLSMLFLLYLIISGKQKKNSKKM